LEKFEGFTLVGKLEEEFSSGFLQFIRLRLEAEAVIPPFDDWEAKVPTGF
jgi:hypothetical protein